MKRSSKRDAKVRILEPDVLVRVTGGEDAKIQVSYKNNASTTVITSWAEHT